MDPVDFSNSYQKKQLEEIRGTLVEMLEIMSEIMDYLQTPGYQNYFAQYDKKLTKNVLKRCIVEVIAERILCKKFNEKADLNPEDHSEEGSSAPMESKCEIDIHLEDKSILSKFNTLLIKLLE